MTELEGELHISWGVVVKVSCSQAVNSLQELLALCQRQSPLLCNVASSQEGERFFFQGERLQGNDCKWCGVSANHPVVPIPVTIPSLSASRCIIPVSFTAAYDRGAQPSSQGWCQEYLIKSGHADPCPGAGQSGQHSRAAAKLDLLSSSWLPQQLEEVDAQVHCLCWYTIPLPLPPSNSIVVAQVQHLCCGAVCPNYSPHNSVCCH